MKTGWAKLNQKIRRVFRGNSLNKKKMAGKTATYGTLKQFYFTINFLWL
jgi:hypothetical protein